MKKNADFVSQVADNLIDNDSGISSLYIVDFCSNSNWHLLAKNSTLTL